MKGFLHEEHKSTTIYAFTLTDQVKIKDIVRKLEDKRQVSKTISLTPR